MSLYEDIGIESSTELVKVKEENSEEKVDEHPSPLTLSFSAPKTPLTAASPAPLSVNKMNLSFLKSQLEAKKAILQNAAAAVSQQKSGSFGGVAQQSPTPALLAPAAVLQRDKQQQQLKRGPFKLKPHKAIPLPIDSAGAFTLVPKSLKEDKVFLFGEVMVEDEYNPTAPTDYSSFKQKREQLRLKEKIAKEIADRLAKEASEEEEKRRKGAAIAPPTAFESYGPDNVGVDGIAPSSAHMPTTASAVVVKEEVVEQRFEQPKLAQFGKGMSRGLGVAANIMSKMGYRQGAGLGAKEQGISRPLEVQRTGKNIGLIFGEESASSVVTSLDERGQEQQQNG
uniref:G-patch domain-containing protein n=1 Tax=Globodera pallida TaxID=36090 RepID=A0A183BKP4_GLOPA